MQMDERKKKVLQAIVLDYIATAEPVGSRTIARKFDLGVSSATIRNEMADLEDMGLIEQPYTSAGRIPSDSGYRYYVDCLMEKVCLSGDERNCIDTVVFQKINRLRELVQETSHLISELTNLTAVVLTPQQSNSPFHQVHLLPYRPAQAIMVVVRENGAVENHIIDVEEGLSADDLQHVTLVLNSKLKGLTFEQIKNSVLREIYLELAKQRDLISLALESLHPVLPEDHNGLVLGGTLNMLNQPEFKDVDKLRGLLKIFEDSQGLKKILSEAIGDGLTVRIGGENKLEEMQDCSLVTASFQVDGQVVGAIGVLGPTRMNYAKTVSLVDFITSNLSAALKK